MARNGERTYLVRSGAAQNTSVAVAMAAATAETAIGVFGTSGTTLSLTGFSVSFDSVTASAVPALVEVGIITAAGTVGTAFTPTQLTGRALASACAAGYNHSGEPTYNKMVWVGYVPVNNGLFVYEYPLGEEPQCDVSQGFAIRVTAPATVNCLPTLKYSE